MFSFVDLFSGIGGFRKGFERAGGRCIFSCEIDKFARLTYQANFDVDHPFPCDIADVASFDLPSCDVLLAGFPYQPFSRGGDQKGLVDRRSYVLSHLIGIIKEVQPRFFVLENVLGMKYVRCGRDFAWLMEQLQFCGYEVDTRIINASHFVAQNRRRLFFLGVRRDSRSHRLSTWDNYCHKYLFEKLPLFDPSKKRQSRVSDCLEDNAVDEHCLSENAIGNVVKRQKKKRRISRA